MRTGRRRAIVAATLAALLLVGALSRAEAVNPLSLVGFGFKLLQRQQARAAQQRSYRERVDALGYPVEIRAAGGFVPAGAGEPVALLWQPFRAEGVDQPVAWWATLADPARSQRRLRELLGDELDQTDALLIASGESTTYAWQERRTVRAPVTPFHQGRPLAVRQHEVEFPFVTSLTLQPLLHSGSQPPRLTLAVSLRQSKPIASSRTAAGLDAPLVLDVGYATLLQCIPGEATALRIPTPDRSREVVVIFQTRLPSEAEAKRFFAAEAKQIAAEMGVR